MDTPITHLNDDFGDLFKIDLIDEFLTPVREICVIGLESYLESHKAIENVSGSRVYYTTENVQVNWRITPATDKTDGIIFFETLVAQVSGVIHWAFSVGNKISKIGTVDMNTASLAMWNIGNHLVFQGPDNKLKPTRITFDFIQKRVEVY